MIPTLGQVYVRARNLIGDTEIPTGQIWDDSKLSEFAASAYTTMFRVLAEHANHRLRRVAYYNVPANQSYLSPAQMGVSNLGEPKNIYERSVSHAAAVSLATPAVASGYLTLTSVAHPFKDGNTIIVYGIAGISDEVNDEWTITVPTVDTIRLMGCLATGTYVSGGVITDSSEGFPDIPMAPLSVMLDIPSTPSTQLSYWSWVGDAFRFWPASTVRQIRLVYTLSGSPPAYPSASIGVDDSLDFLGAHTAALALQAKGIGNDAAAKFLLSVGNPQGEAGSGQNGYLGQLVRPGVKDLQMTERLVLPRFREKRNVGPFNRY